mmetsp:Transcript_54238/g.97743  ORF Transcript_54238/g.97743 Transcript_54238/m.97743 type:complete len:127 (+) Transcript_54238:233-613(+)
MFSPSSSWRQCGLACACWSSGASSSEDVGKGWQHLGLQDNMLTKILGSKMRQFFLKVDVWQPLKGQRLTISCCTTLRKALSRHSDAAAADLQLLFVLYAVSAWVCQQENASGCWASTVPERRQRCA